MTYRQFLQSVLWEELRQTILRRDNHRCRRCGRRASQVHHLDPAKSWIDPKLLLLYAAGAIAGCMVVLTAGNSLWGFSWVRTRRTGSIEVYPERTWRTGYATSFG